MSATRWLKTLLFVVLVMAAGVSAALAQEEPSDNLLEVDVAEDGARFIFSSERLFDDGMPQYGTPFVTQGYLYPAGTLSGSDGVRPDGTPEFPALVIGEWTCYGWMIGDGAHTTTGEWVISTQVYQFNEANGGGIIVTDGFELVDIGVAGTRAITGGTGAFRGVDGVQTQTLLGFTEQMGVNLSVQFGFDGVMAQEAAAKPVTHSAPVEPGPIHTREVEALARNVHVWEQTYSWDAMREPEVAAAIRAAAAPAISGTVPRD